MFVSGGQFYVFVATLAFGGACGILFSISELVKFKICNIFLRIIPDFFAFILTSGLYVVYSKWMCFPNFRMYMAIGVLTGIILYFKSFHFLLAKCLKVLYNKCTVFFNVVKNKFILRNKRKDGRIES